MDITKLIAYLPTSVKNDIIDFTNVVLEGTRKPAMRVTMDRLLTEEEKETMRKNEKHIIGIDCKAQYRYAPEIEKSYFYVF